MVSHNNVQKTNSQKKVNPMKSKKKVGNQFKDEPVFWVKILHKMFTFFLGKTIKASTIHSIV